MPLYDFKCDNCGATKGVEEKTRDEALQTLMTEHEWWQSMDTEGGLVCGLRCAAQLNEKRKAARNEEKP